MKFSQDSIWTISPPALKLLKQIEFFSKSQEIVPFTLLKSKNSFNVLPLLFDLVKSKFLRYETLPYVGYKITIAGCDCLAINTLKKRGLSILGDKVGIGKESDIYYGVYNNNNVILKLHRLGRTSFRNIKNKRSFYNKSSSWYEMSKTSAEREYEFMKNNKDLPIPIVYDYDRHIVVMEFLDSYTLLNDVKEIEDKDFIYCRMMEIIEQFYEKEFVHGDFNEFNLLIKGNDVKVIDFPQCIKLNNKFADEYLKRDIEGIQTFFMKRFRYTNDYMPIFDKH